LDVKKTLAAGQVCVSVHQFKTNATDVRGYAVALVDSGRARSASTAADILEKGKEEMLYRSIKHSS